MKRPQVDFIIPSIENEAEGMILHFTSVEEIDSVIASLEEARSELEHMVEMRRQKIREKRFRRKIRKHEDKIRSSFEKILEDEAVQGKIELPHGVNVEINTETGKAKIKNVDFGDGEWSIVVDLHNEDVVDMLKKVRGWTNDMRKGHK